MEALRALRERHGDLILALVVGTLIVVINLLDDTLSPWEKLVWAAAAAVAATLLAVRVRVPLLLLVAALALTVMSITPLGGEDDLAFALVVVVAVYNAAVYAEQRHRIAAAAAIVAFGLALAISDGEAIGPAGLVFFGLFLGAPWVAGRAIRLRRAREAQLEERTTLLEREREEKARAAVAEERQRIARELHDVVAHAISVIVIQARGGRRLLAADPGQARAAFDTIERSGAEALAEMRRLLELLRASEDTVAFAPQPGVAQIEGLAEQMRDSGLPVEVTVVGSARPLPPGLDLSAYRIVQEALTNTLKHAGPAHARVLVRYADDCLELEVVDDGAPQANGGGTGHGLVGMRERVAVYGGELHAGRRPEGGFALRARLPVVPQP
jgi:signal transduction histidine kinase